MVLGIVERDIRYAEEIRQYLTEIEKYKQALRPSKIRNDPIASRQLQQRIAELLEKLRAFGRLGRRPTRRRRGR